jgi:SAM-dependent methyltransferase
MIALWFGCRRAAVNSSSIKPSDVLEPGVLAFRRILGAYRRGGLNYVWYKVLKRTLQNHPRLARHVLYRSPRWYWEQRGLDYYREQESQTERTARSAFLADQVASYKPTSLLEIGCGYGKQIAAVRPQVSGPVVGVDWSSSQLALARSLLAPYENIFLLQVDGSRLPFPSGAFDVVLTSAVILHNPPHIARLIRQEICRVGRRLAIHNEDTNTTFSRFGYDTATEYRQLGYSIIDCRPIPGSANPETTQFCVVDLRNVDIALRASSK